MTYPRVESAFEVEANPCFEDSRRLMGMNRYFDGPAAILETRGPWARDEAALQRWQQIAGDIARELWRLEDAPVARVHAAAAELVIRCPPDQLYTATEVNEYAWETAALGNEAAQHAHGFERIHRFSSDTDMRRYFTAISLAEREPVLAQIREAARERNLPVVLDDDTLSLGAGRHSAVFPLAHLPRPARIDWHALGRIPVVLVTGSNGKTTTARLIAAMLDRAGGEYAGHVGLCGTGGIVIGGEKGVDGDYSGPAGARTVLRDRRVAAAVLETARGGILRRGLAVEDADVAVVTNISADHFGEYGIDTLDDIAEAKLAVARPLGPRGTLVLNADDEVLMRHRPRQACRIGLFSLRADGSAVEGWVGQGARTCVLEQAELVLRDASQAYRLGPVADMPLAVGGAADYNIANLAAAALAAWALGVDAQVIRTVVREFGRLPQDNPGRFERWTIGGVEIVMDYAHNPDGLARLLRVCATLAKKGGRLFLLLGQAGNRTDADIRDLARVAASFAPDRIAIKELPDMLRGRAPGDVPALLQAALLEAGTPAVRLGFHPDEEDAARRLVEGAQAGDVVVLPVHRSASRAALHAWLAARRAS